MLLKYGQKFILDPYIRCIYITIILTRSFTPSITSILGMIFMNLLLLLLLLLIIWGLLLLVISVLPQIPSLMCIGTLILKISFEEFFYRPAMGESIEIMVVLMSLEHDVLNEYRWNKIGTHCPNYLTNFFFWLSTPRYCIVKPSSICQPLDTTL